jgi:threonine dehydratase
MDIYNIYELNKEIINNTPLQLNKRLSNKYNCNIFLKREDLQIVRSFKIRGAYNKINKLTLEEKEKGIVCASAGNHAQGVAYSCNILNIDSTIFVPENTPPQKIKSIKKFSNSRCKLFIIGKNFDEAYELSKKYTLEHNKTYIHPFGDIDVINGQGTVAVEIYNELTPDIIISCVGGGGLISGISKYSKYKKTNCLIYGAESLECNSMYQSIQNNKVIRLDKYDTFVDGTAVKEVSELTFNICKKNVEDILLVSNGQLCNTILELYQDDGIITEPAGALAVSSLENIDKTLIKGKNIVCIISGGNNDVTRYPEIQDIALRYLNLKHYFIIKFTQKPGELRKFVNNILNDKDDITRFEYIKKKNSNYGQVIVGIQLFNPNDLQNIKNNLENHNFNYIYINDNDLLMSYLI